MTAISAAAAIAQLIRQHGIGRRCADAASKAEGQQRRSKPPTTGTGADDMASLVLRRIRFIEPADPDRRRKAFRIFIESVLLFEIGPDLVNDPAFHTIVDEVESRMRSEPSLRRDIDNAADMLLSTPRP
jgi:hypothetical protein